MGILRDITNPFRFAGHVATGTVGRTAAAAGGFFSANAAMGGLRLQLKSYEAKEFFDSKQLAKYFREYKRVRKKMLRYRSKKGKEGVSNYVQEKIYNKHKDNPELLNKVLLHEIRIFAGYYERFLQVVSAIELKERDIELQKSGGIIKDENEMISLIQKIPETKDTLLMRDDLRKFKEKVEKMERKEKREVKLEYEWKQRLAAGGRYALKPVKGIVGFIGRLHGINFLAHKIRKLSKRIFTRDYRRFDEEFKELQGEINSGKVTPVTFAKLMELLKNYAKIRKYYHEIDKDLALVTSKIFEDFDIILDECVVPFYAAVKNISGADEILKITNQLKEEYNASVKDLRTEQFEIKKVYAQLLKFTEVCQEVVSKIQNSNNEVIQNLQQRMAVTKPAFAT